MVVDFTELPQAGGGKCLFVFVCALSAWIEVFPVLMGRASEVIWLLREVISGFGIPVALGSDTGPTFAAEKVQLVAKGLKITWKLHKSYHP